MNVLWNPVIGNGRIYSDSKEAVPAVQDVSLKMRRIAVLKSPESVDVIELHETQPRDVSQFHLLRVALHGRSADQIEIGDILGRF